MRNFLLLFAIVSLSGCYTQKKAGNQMVKAHVEYPVLTSFYCNQWYPIRWYDSTRIEYIRGEVDYIHDTVTVDCDTVKVTVDGTKTVRVPCPPCPVRVDTIVTFREKQGESTAALEHERQKLIACQQGIDDLNKKATKSRVYLLITGVLALYTVVRWVVRFWGVKLP